MLAFKDDRLHHQKLTQTLFQGSKASLIVLTTCFHGLNPIKLWE